jgi:hypothetical protein
MANNGGRQGGGGGNGQMNEHVEFTVKVSEILASHGAPNVFCVELVLCATHGNVDPVAIVKVIECHTLWLTRCLICLSINNNRQKKIST